MIFDTHAHYDDEAFEEDRDELLQSMQTHGIGKIVNIGANMQTSQNTVQLVDRYPWMYGAVGVHPNEVGTMTEADLAILKSMTKQSRIVAIGEIGLDYHYDDPEPTVQKKWFERQMELARQEKLPIVVHSREAAKDTVDIMKYVHAEEIGGVVHCFSYTKELAREFLAMNYYIGIGGVLTFKNAKKLKEAVEYIPLNRIVLETDCPYLAPEPYRGSRNSSQYLPQVVAVLAQLKGITEEEVMNCTNVNAHDLYHIPLENK